MPPYLRSRPRDSDERDCEQQWYAERERQTKGSSGAAPLGSGHWGPQPPRHPEQRRLRRDQRLQLPPNQSKLSPRHSKVPPLLTPLNPMSARPPVKLHDASFLSISAPPVPLPGRSSGATITPCISACYPSCWSRTPQEPRGFDEIGLLLVSCRCRFLHRNSIRNPTSASHIFAAQGDRLGRVKWQQPYPFHSRSSTSRTPTQPSSSRSLLPATSFSITHRRLRPCRSLRRHPKSFEDLPSSLTRRGTVEHDPRCLKLPRLNCWIWARVCYPTGFSRKSSLLSMPGGSDSKVEEKERWESRIFGLMGRKRGKVSVVAVLSTSKLTLSALVESGGHSQLTNIPSSTAHGVANLMVLRNPPSHGMAPTSAARPPIPPQVRISASYQPSVDPLQCRAAGISDAEPTIR